jgi:KDO2-lipid IV(A) lauroyltransferase
MLQRKKKKKKERNAILDWLGYAAVRIVFFILGWFPIEWNLRLACVLGRLLWKYYPRGRQRALENLQAAYPEQESSWHEQVGRRSFEHLVMLVMDVFFTPRLVVKDRWKEYARLINIERVKWMMQEKKGLLMATGHYGNFEIIGYMLGQWGFPVYSIARPLDNPYLNRYLYGIRQRHGQKIIDKFGASDQMEQIIKEGATLCFIADQDAGRKGIFVDFFGRKASSYKSIPLLAIHYELPLVIGGSRRVGNRFFFEMECSRIILPEEWKNQKDPLGWLAQEYTRALEEFIRKDPTQYWWIHRRWKTRPKEELSAASTEELSETHP